MGSDERDAIVMRRRRFIGAALAAAGLGGASLTCSSSPRPCLSPPAVCLSPLLEPPPDGGGAGAEEGVGGSDGQDKPATIATDPQGGSAP